MAKIVWYVYIERIIIMKYNENRQFKASLGKEI